MKARTKLLLAAAIAAALASCERTQDAAIVETTGSAEPAAQARVAAQQRAPLTPRPQNIVPGQAVPVIAHPDPLAILHNDDPALAANKRLLFDMWRTVLNAGHLEAADTFVAENYIQHSPFQRSGREALKETFSVIPRSEAIPEIMRPAPVSIVTEGDLVVLVAVDTYDEPDGSGTYTTTHFNMFRIVDGKLAAHWHPDRNPPCPGLPSAAEGGPQPVTGATGVDQLALLVAATPELEANKRLVFDAWRELVEAGREEVADLYLAPDYIQHNPNAATGREAAKAYFATREDLPVESTIRSPLVAMIAEGDLVVQVVKVELPDPYRPGEIYTTAWFDMFRIADGMLVEHWDAATKPGTLVEELGAACTDSAA
jgi:predicted SnoaL-like aldol condensation-catalyzing enzyme